MDNQLTPQQRNEELQRQQAEHNRRPDVIADRQRYEENRAIAEESAKLDGRIGKIGAALRQAAGDSPRGQAKAREILDRTFGERMPVTDPAMRIFQKKEALGTILALIEQAEAALPQWIEEISVLVREHLRQQAEATERVLEAKTQELGRSMSDAELIDLLESPRYRAKLQLNKKGQIEIAPPHYATDRRVRGLIRMHSEGLKELLADRQRFAEVDLGEPIATITDRE